MRPRLLAAAVALLVLSACSDGDGFETSRTGETVSVFELDVGDCFDDPENPEVDVEEVALFDCDVPHDNEVYFVFDFDAEEFPGEAAIPDEALERCIAEFEDYVGAPFEESELEAGPLLVPTEESWEVGDREVVCAVWTEDGSKLDGSVEGSEQ